MRHSRVHLCLLAALLAVVAATGCGPEEPATPEKKRLLLIGQGPDGHPPGTHEFLPGVRILAHCLKQFPDLEADVVSADEPWSEGPALLDSADGLVLFVSEGAKWLSNDPDRLAAMQRFARKGGALVVLHWGMGTVEAKNIAAFVKLFGGCHGGPDRKHDTLEVTARIPAPTTRSPAAFPTSPSTTSSITASSWCSRPRASFPWCRRTSRKSERPLPGPGNAAAGGVPSASAACTFTETGGWSPTAGWPCKPCCGRCDCRPRRPASTWMSPRRC